MPPRATYRLQFHRGFTLADAREQVPYLRQLGVSHLYASPLLKALPGSTHGYDGCDFSRLNPELGTPADLADLAATLRQHQMGLVLDIVPNHMGFRGNENPWWWDLLTHGPASRFAAHFDIDWQSPDPRTRGKVLLPILGDRFDRVLQRGELHLEQQPDGLVLCYYDHRFPIAPGSLPGLPAATSTGELLAEINRSPDQLDALLQQQHYRLTFWRHGDRELNYRRFFNITTLAGVRVEDPAVFADVHACLFAWHARGWIDGFRIDHPDGLRDPEEYLRRLHRAAPAAWIVIEKILEPGEQLPADWPIAGTTGYDFLNRVHGLLVDPAAEPALTALYREFTGEPADYATVLREAKTDVLAELFPTELNRLTALLQAVAATRWQIRDFSPADLHAALTALIVHFPVYRTYARAGEATLSPADHAHIAQAVASARLADPERDALLEFIGRLLQRECCGPAEDEFVLRFQQLTGPAMAKGAEDTAFYRYHRLSLLNEVGGDPGRFGLDLPAFHQTCAAAAAHWPHALLATSTHDTKRSEDVRARLALLTEIPEPWRQAVQRWSAQNSRFRRGPFPDRNTEYLLYQTLVGAWPLPVDRAVAYLEKAACEAKRHTNWTNHNEPYEAALRDFIASALSDPTFTRDLAAFVAPLIEPGYVNALTQTLIKLTAPGIPDLYQGTEFWDLSLVDPDNRRPVDYAARQRALDALAPSPAPEVVWDNRAEGWPKLWLIQRTLHYRAAHPHVFNHEHGYAPVPVTGPKAAHAVAFVRGGQALTLAPRLVLGLGGNWADTTLTLPPGRWTNELTGELWKPGPQPVQDLLHRFPVALLTRIED